MLLLHSFPQDAIITNNDHLDLDSQEEGQESEDGTAPEPATIMPSSTHSLPAADDATPARPGGGSPASSSPRLTPSTATSPVEHSVEVSRVCRGCSVLATPSKPTMSVAAIAANVPEFVQFV